MGSSAQNSSGVHWCRRPVGFNKVPEKVQKVPEKVWEACLVRIQVRLNRFPEKVPEKVPASLGAKPSQAQQISGEGCREDPGEGFGDLWCRARSSSTGSGEGCRENFVKIKCCGCWGYHRGLFRYRNGPRIAISWDDFSVLLDIYTFNTEDCFARDLPDVRTSTSLT